VLPAPKSEKELNMSAAPKSKHQDYRGSDTVQIPGSEPGREMLPGPARSPKLPRRP
jgi:hypothetical protein